MGSEKVQRALNEQVGHEFYAAYLYLSMAIYLEAESLDGFAHWMRMQSREEVAHALRIVDFLNDRGGRVELQAIEKPPSEFDGPLAVARLALEHEQEVTGAIEELYELAQSEKDHPAQVFLQWFITEQVEEESSARDLVDQVSLAGDSGGALLVLDERLGRRTPDGD